LKVQNTCVFPVAKLSVVGVAGVFVISVASAQAPPTIWDGVYTDEQAKRGAALYQTQCAACHGDTLLGAEMAPALAGDTFNSTWDGVPLTDLLDRIRTTMPQTAPGSLSRVQVAEVLAFILQFGKFPAGDKLLESQTVGATTFRAYRP
jgi:mono/diheme cytochrome c family protein